MKPGLSNTSASTCLASSTSGSVKNATRRRLDAYALLSDRRRSPLSQLMPGPFVAAVGAASFPPFGVPSDAAPPANSSGLPWRGAMVVAAATVVLVGATDEPKKIPPVELG